MGVDNSESSCIIGPMVELAYTVVLETIALKACRFDSCWGHCGRGVMVAY